MVSNSILRERARMQLGNGIFTNSWLTMALIYIIFSAIMSAASSATVGIAALIVAGPLTYGVHGITLACARGFSWKIEHLFKGFTKAFGESIILNLLQSVFIFLWSMLFVIPGIVKTYSYAMSYYIANDNPGLSANECITKSREMMRGHKWQLFCLDLSFVGWYIIGSLCFGLGTLLVVPYHEVARANFYAELKMEADGYNGVNDSNINVDNNDNTNENNGNDGANDIEWF